MRMLRERPPESRKVGPIGKKGESNLYYIAMGVLVTFLILAGVKYFHDRDNDVTIHLPHVEVH